MLREHLRSPLAERRRRPSSASRAAARLKKARIGATRPVSPAPRAGAQCDQAELRERAAGGPLDSACYSCACGFVFQAPVSTDVSCPHCGEHQAW